MWTFFLSPPALTVTLDGIVCPWALLANFLSWDQGDVNSSPDSCSLCSEYIANK
ncbi:aldolase 3, C isoform, isoform CRA_a [Mus musculus]|nr:aldolase 3, C isoform, isoform CRA_a [Mus musculus]